MNIYFSENLKKLRKERELTQEALADLKQVISNFFASELEKEMNQLWESGEMTEEKVEGFRNLHERTPYK